MIGVHRWVHKSNPDGEDYLECERCQTSKVSITLNDFGDVGGPGW
jgi:hypothetical protein